MSTAEWPRPVEQAARPRAKERAARPRAVPDKGVSEPALADFQSVEIHAIDAEKWPVVPVLWWQPELPIEAPRTSGLRNERQHKVSAAGFINAEAAPVCPEGAIATPRPAITADQAVAIPASDLTPLGWDPRASAAKGRE